MALRVRLINGKGDWEADPPTGASDHDLYHIANDLFSNGGVVDRAGGDGLVTEQDTPGMSVKVAKGTYYVPNSSWTKNSAEPKFFQVVQDADVTILIDSNSSGETVTVLIAIKVDKITAPNDEGTNIATAVKIVGTPGDGEPALPDDHELLAVVTVEDLVAAISNEDIADRREKVSLDPSFIASGITTLPDGTTINIDTDGGKNNKFLVTIQGNRTFDDIDIPVGYPVLLYVIQGTGGNKTVTFFAPNITDYGDDLPIGTAAGELDGFVIVKLPDGRYSITKVATAQS